MSTYALVSYRYWWVQWVFDFECICASRRVR